MVGLMKRKNNIYYKICDIDNIIYVYNQIKINNKVRKEKFNDFYSMNIVDIYNKLNSKNYIFDKYNVFTIYEPKKRIIMSLKIKDKIVKGKSINKLKATLDITCLTASKSFIFDIISPVVLFL